jgi:hypothetical protein
LLTNLDKFGHSRRAILRLGMRDGPIIGAESRAATRRQTDQPRHISGP